MSPPAHLSCLVMGCRMAAREGGHFVTIAAAGHGAPAAPAGARGIVEKEAAVAVGADAKAGGCTFRDELGG